MRRALPLCPWCGAFVRGDQPSVELTLAAWHDYCHASASAEHAVHLAHERIRLALEPRP